MSNTIKQLECKICGHKWFPRSTERPGNCPNQNCRSLRWDKGPRVKKESNDKGKVSAQE